MAEANTMEDNSRFTRLLDRYLANEATNDEQKELMKLIREGSNDEQIKSRIGAVMEEEDDEDMSMENAQIILAKIFKQKQGRVIPFVQQPVIRWVAAASVVIAAAASVWFFTKNNTTPSTQLAQYENVQPAVFQDKQYVKLPDGSTVILSKGSELRHSEKFGQGTRDVTLIGEAYFDIAHDPTRPFHVITDKVTTTVLGTAFNVSAWPGQENVTVTVTRGKVQVADEFKVFGVIKPNEQISVSTATNEFTQTTNVKEADAIRNKYLMFEHVSMETAAAIIEERYNTKLIFENEAIKNCRVTARFLDGEDLNQIMVVVSGVIEASYTIQPDGSVRLKGNGCK